MNQTTEIDLGYAVELRVGLEDAWREAYDPLHDAEDETWHRSHLNPDILLSATPRLHLLSTYQLVAYIFKSRRDRTGVVWAIPSRAAIPEPKDCTRTESPRQNWTLARVPELAPPRPGNALPEVMSAIEGDGSPASYLMASLLAREFAEFGAEQHGVFWSDFTLTQPTHLNESWAWVEPAPASWNPYCVQNGDQVTVRFYTYTELDERRITSHTDHYQAGSYTFADELHVLARGGRGIWH